MPSLHIVCLLIMLNFCLSGSHVHRVWLKETTTTQIQINPQSVTILCFEKPTILSWLTNCLKDFNVFVKVVGSTPGRNPTQYPVQVYEGLLYREVGSDISCSALDSMFSESSTFELLSSLLTNSLLTSKKFTLTPDGFNWSSPSYSPSCVAMCSKSNLFADLLSLEVTVHTQVNLRHLLFTVLGFTFLFASTFLSSNLMFYYFSGSGLIVFGSFLILLIMFIRVLPFRRGGAILQTAVVLLGSTFSLILVALDYARASVLQFLADNIELTFIYTIAVMVLSLLFFYWLHLPERLVFNYPRTKTIMKYLLQLLGASMLVSSVHLPIAEEELVLHLLDWIPSFLYSTISLSPSSAQALRRLSSKFLWVFVVALTVFLINLWNFVCSRLFGCGQEQSPLNKLGQMDFSDHLPGSPWACSSPCGYNFAGGIGDAKRFSMSEPFSPRTSLRPGQCSSSHANGTHLYKGTYIYTRKPPDDLMTDDESD